LLQPDKEEAPEAQVQHFIQEVARCKTKGADDHVLLALYWAAIFPPKMREDPAARLQEDEMTEQELSISRYPSVDGTVRAVKEVIRLTGKAPVMLMQLALLSSFVSRQSLSADQKETLSECPLWIISFSGKPVVLPAGSPWNNWTFWLHTTHDLYRNDPDRPIAPDLSDFIGKRGADLDSWLLANCWDYQLRAKLK
jgi:hypothetical protein